MRDFEADRDTAARQRQHDAHSGAARNARSCSASNLAGFRPVPKRGSASLAKSSGELRGKANRSYKSYRSYYTAMNEEHACCHHERPPAAAASRGRRHLHLPDASGDRAGSSRAIARSAEWPWSRRRFPPATLEDDSELIDMTRRFWIGAALTLPVFLLAMSHLFPNAPAWLSGDASRWIQFVLSTPVVLWAGWPFFKRGWRSLQSAQPQHVYAHRDRRRRGLLLQRGRHVLSGRCFRRRWRTTERSEFISKPRR